MGAVAAIGAGLVMGASAVEAAPVVDVSYNDDTRVGYVGGWGGGDTGWEAGTHLLRTHATVSDSLDGDGAAQYTVSPSADPATTYWRAWFGSDWFGVNNAEAVANPGSLEVSFDAKATNLGNNLPGTIRLALRAFRSGADVGWAQEDVQSGSADFVLSDTWDTYSAPLSAFGDIDLSTTRNFLVAEFQLSADGGSGFAGFNASGDSSLYLDNFRVEVVPEPGALALLGLGSVAMLRRRRRP